MRDTKDLILETAYEMFLCNNYEAVTMNSICRETKLTKGAVYHYFQSKEALFKAVVEKFMLECVSEITPESMSLFDFIELKIKQIMDRRERFKALNSNHSPKMASQYMSLLVAANRYYPGFAEMGINYLKLEFGLWKSILEKAIENGEIRSLIDTEIMAMNFISILTNLVLSIMKGEAENFELMVEKQLLEMYKVLKK